MLEFKQGQDARFPVRLLDVSGNAITGVVFGSVQMSLMYSDGTFATVTVNGGNWSELTTGQFASSGTYTVVVPLSQINKTGILMYIVVVAGAVSYVNYVKIVANEEADTFAALVRGLGLLHENTVVDQTVYDTNNNLTSARLRLYDSAAHAQTPNVSTPTASYSITATFIGANMQTYTVVRVT